VNRCRRVESRRRRRNQRPGIRSGSGWGKSAYCPAGVRHEGGVNLIQALVRNVGTCRRSAKGDAQGEVIFESQSTDMRHRDGAARSREESSVMELDRRGSVIRPDYADNPQGEDRRG
jgi:hypothetical protein